MLYNPHRTIYVAVAENHIHTQGTTHCTCIIHMVVLQVLKKAMISLSAQSPVPILSLCLHPGGKRLLVHSTTGRLAMIDLRV